MGEKFEKGRGVFANDETDSRWHRQNEVEILKKFCPEGYATAKKYGHFIIGNAGNVNYIGIPGRFLIEEQPAGGKTGFTLWQPLKGGEQMYDSLETIDEHVALKLYGYWIAKLDSKTLEISEA